jgi:hypothetical protein
MLMLGGFQSHGLLPCNPENQHGCANPEKGKLSRWRHVGPHRTWNIRRIFPPRRWWRRNGSSGRGATGSTPVDGQWITAKEKKKPKLRFMSERQKERNKNL